MPALILDNATGELLFLLTLERGTPDGTARVATSPVERGVATADHVQPEAATLKATVLISDHPIEFAAEPGLTANTWAALDALRRNPRLVDVVLPLTTHRSYVLTGVSAPYTAASGQGLAIDLTWQELVITSATTVGVPASILAAAIRASGKGKGDTGGAPKGESKKQGQARRKTLLKGTADALRRKPKGGR